MHVSKRSACGVALLVWFLVCFFAGRWLTFNRQSKELNSLNAGFFITSHMCETHVVLSTWAMEELIMLAPSL